MYIYIYIYIYVCIYIYTHTHTHICMYDRLGPMTSMKMSVRKRHHRGNGSPYLRAAMSKIKNDNFMRASINKINSIQRRALDKAEVWSMCVCVCVCVYVCVYICMPTHIIIHTRTHAHTHTHTHTTHTHTHTHTHTLSLSLSLSHTHTSRARALASRICLPVAGTSFSLRSPWTFTSRRSTLLTSQ